MGKSIMKSISDNISHILLVQLIIILGIYHFIKPEDLEHFLGWTLWVIALNMMLLASCRLYDLFVDMKPNKTEIKKRESKDV